MARSRTTPTRTTKKAPTRKKVATKKKKAPTRRKTAPEIPLKTISETYSVVEYGSKRNRNYLKFQPTFDSSEYSHIVTYNCGSAQYFSEGELYALAKVWLDKDLKELKSTSVNEGPVKIVSGGGMEVALRSRGSWKLYRYNDSRVRVCDPNGYEKQFTNTEFKRLMGALVETFAPPAKAKKAA